jgi:hypothetical protein
MNRPLKKFTYLCGFTLALAAVFLAAPQAHAASPDLQVEFENGSSPLWSVSAFAPGAHSTAWVKVTNNTATTQRVMTEAINGTDPDGLGNAMTLTITGDTAGQVYSGNFGTFLRAGETELSDLAPGATETYWYDVTFDSASGDSVQAKSLGFDLCVGFKAASGGKNCGGTVISGGGTTPPAGGGGTSGGGGGSNFILIIRNEQAESSIALGNSALVTWDTNLLSTSQVIYGPASGNYNLDLTAACFGYPSCTSEDTTKVTSHSVVLSGLVPGETYKYRVVSHASPPTVSYEHTFAVPVPVTPPNTPALAAIDNGAGAGLTAASSSEASTTESTTTSDNTETAAASTRNLAAALFGLPDSVMQNLVCLGTALLIMILLYFLREAFVDRSGRKPRVKVGATFLGAAIATAILVATGYLCPIMYLWILAIALMLFDLKRIGHRHA